jgi:hypothetical protein
MNEKDRAVAVGKTTKQQVQVLLCQFPGSDM